MSIFKLIFTLCSNYGPTIAVQNEAMKKGCQQVLWLYGEEEEITEVGTMNLFVYWTNAKGGEFLFNSSLSGLLNVGAGNPSADLISVFVCLQRKSS